MFPEAGSPGSSLLNALGPQALGCPLFLPFVEGMGAGERCERGMNEHWVLEEHLYSPSSGSSLVCDPLITGREGCPFLLTRRRNVLQRQEGQKQLTDKRSDLITGEEQEGLGVTSSEGSGPDAQTLCLLAFCVHPPLRALCKYLRSRSWEPRGEQSRASLCSGGVFL